MDSTLISNRHNLRERVILNQALGIFEIGTISLKGVGLFRE